MKLIPLLLTFNDSPGRLTVGHQVAAGRLAWDVKLLYDRETKLSTQFHESDVNEPNLAAPIVHIPQDAQGDYLWERQGRVNQTDDDWYNISQWLHDNTEYSWESDILLVWIAGNPGDHTGIGGPYQALGWNNDRDPEVGGVALNGIGQINAYLGAGFQGEWARRMVLYAAHETGHALGERHSGFDETGADAPNDVGYYMNVMGYGYNFLAAGIEDTRSGKYVEDGGLFTPDQRERISNHSLFVDRPAVPNQMHAGRWDGKELRNDSMHQLLRTIDQAQVTKEEIIARVNIGPMQSER